MLGREASIESTEERSPRPLATVVALVATALSVVAILPSAASASASSSPTESTVTVSGSLSCMMHRAVDGASSGTCGSPLSIGESHECDIGTAFPPHVCEASRALVGFDVAAALPNGAVVQHAEVATNEAPNVLGVGIFEVTAPWTEEVDWDTRDGVAPWSYTCCALRGGAQYDRVQTLSDVTELVRAWATGQRPNRGLLFTARYNLASSDPVSIAPTLTVTYDVPSDVATPGVDAAGDIVDLADDHVSGQSLVSAVVAADDDQKGIAHLGVSEVGGAELGGVDVDCGTPRSCPIDADDGFEVDLRSLGAGKRVLHATARDDAGKVGVSERWAIYVDRQAPGTVTNVEASKIDGESAQVYWTEPQDPVLPDGSPGSGTTEFSYRYRVDLGAWSSWSLDDVSGITVPGAIVGSRIDLEVSSIDSVGNAGPLTAATVTVTAADGSDSAGIEGPTENGSTQRGSVAADPEEHDPPLNNISIAFFCGIGPAIAQSRLGRGTFDIQNAVRGYGTVRCWNNATNPRSAARVVASRQSIRICVTVPRAIPQLPIVVKCRTTEARAPIAPSPIVFRDTEINEIKDLCVSGNRQYAMSYTVRVIGPVRNVTGPRPPFVFRSVYDCNEAGAWRHLARRGRGSASRQLGSNITAPRCSGAHCDSLPEHGTSGPRRGWQAHHIIPGGEGRNFENNATAQASRAQTFAYSCNQRPNEPPNGAWLRGSDLRWPSQGYMNLSRAERERPKHANIHTIGYYQAVADRLDRFVNADDTCSDNDGLINELQEIKREVIFGTFSGLPAASKQP